MRRIIYLQPAGEELADAVLEECSLYTPLIEPQEDGSLFCDLSGCGPASDILRAIVKRNYLVTGERIEISLASSRIAAENALKRSCLPAEKIYRCMKRKEVRFIEILPGQEEEFIASIPLEEFTGLTLQESRKLKRAGFSKVGELKGVPTSRLVSLLGNKGVLLARKCQGIDDMPVLGLYPPLEISYPLIFTEGSFNRVSNAAQIKEACRVLQEVLKKRNSGCLTVGLELKTAGLMVKKEKRLKAQGHRVEFLAAVIEGMLDKTDFKHPPEEGRIILGGISALEWEEQDLFALYPCEKKDSSLRLDKIMDKLKNRFPGKLMFGPEECRREKILAYFDPWRSDTGKDDS